MARDVKNGLITTTLRITGNSPAANKIAISDVSGNLSWSLLNAVNFNPQAVNTILAGPGSGGSTTPTFRALVAADIPILTLSKISDAGTIASQNANAVAITGGTINGAVIGGVTPATVAATTAYVGSSGGPVATELTVVTTSASDPRGIMSAQYSTDALASRLHLRKARGTPAVPLVIVPGDILGRIRFSGYDGASFLQMASIDAVSTGTIASTRVPTYLSFSVATDAAPSVLTEVARLTITGLNNTIIGGTTPAAITGTIITATTRFVGPILAPSADSTTALKLTKADGATAVVTVDTTNSALIVGTSEAGVISAAKSYVYGAGSAYGVWRDTTNDTEFAVGTDSSGSFIGAMSAHSLGIRTNNASRIILGSGDSTTAIRLMKANGTTAVVTVDTTNSRVGIGVTPGFQLQVGTGATSGIAATNGIFLADATSVYLTVKAGTNAEVFTGSDASTAYGIFGTLSNHDLGIRTNNVLRMRIDTAGITTHTATDANTATVTDVAILDHTGGVGANGLGTGVRLRGYSSTSAVQPLARLRSAFISATNASYTSQGWLSSWYMNSGTPTEVDGISWGTNASGGKLLAFNGNALFAQPTYGAPTGSAADRSTFDPSSVTLVQLAQRVRALIDDFRSRGDFA